MGSGGNKSAGCGVSWMVGLRGGGMGTQGRERREHQTMRKPPYSGQRRVSGERVEGRGRGVVKEKNKIDSFFFPLKNVENLSKNVDNLNYLRK